MRATYIEHPDISTNNVEHRTHDPFWIFEASEATVEARD